MAEKSKWYVIHTYSGYENKVATNLEKIIENRKLEDVISEVCVPMETVVEKTEKGEKEHERKIYPGYVFVKMILTDDTWYIVRNTRGVTGFVGSTSKAIPLTDEEVAKLGVEKRVVNHDYEVGESVKVVDGALNGFTGVIEKISSDKKTISVIVSMFGRETPVELSPEQITPAE